MSQTETTKFYRYSAAEEQRIKQAVAKVTAQTEGNATPEGNWVPFYQELSQIMAGHLDNPTPASQPYLDHMKSFKLWLDVAIGANGGVGMHSAFIRTFTNVQGMLRLGREFTEAEMQLASNGVAFNLWKDINKTWSVGEIRTIADNDARAIGEKLYAVSANLADKSDTAITKNAAWSGTIGFNLLGGDPPYESERLYQGNNNDTVVDKLDDLKNILFAVYSYEQALKAGRKEGGSRFVEFITSLNFDFPDDFSAQWNIATYSGNYAGFILDVLERTPAVYDIAKIILDRGYGGFLNAIQAALTGKHPDTKTTSDTFVSDAFNFFQQFSGTELRETIGIQVLPEDTGSLIQSAQSSIETRVALKMLSPIAFTGIDYNKFNTKGELDLYSSDNPNGMTETYIRQRAQMLQTLMHQNAHPADAGLSLMPFNPNPYFADLDSRIDAAYGGFGKPIGSQTLFGTDGNDTEGLTGGGSKDYLFGGLGIDVLKGEGGSDYLEGGQDKDSYYIEGDDTVFDSDMQGEILFSSDGKTLSPGSLNNTAHDLWKSTDGTFSAVRTNGSDLRITREGSSDSVTVKDFFTLARDNGQGGLEGLGMSLEQAQRQPQPPRRTVAGTGNRYNVFYAEDGRYTEVYGGSLDDILFAYGYGGVLALMGKGNDRVFGSPGADRIEGGEGNDMLNGSVFVPANTDKPQADLDKDADIIIGGAGRDLINGMAGNDIIHTDSENAHLSGRPSGERGDWALGHLGNDVIYGSEGRDFLLGGEGGDVLHGGADDDVLLGDAFIRFGNKTRQVTGVPPSASVQYVPGYVGVATANIVTLPGNAVGAEHRTSSDKEGKTTVKPLYAASALHADTDKWSVTIDRAAGDYAVETAVPLYDDEHRVASGGAADYLYGGAGNDLIIGQDGGDFLWGEAGDDILWGDDNRDPSVSGDDLLYGGAGSDRLYGGGGNDLLDGGSGINVLSGGQGFDTYVLGAADAAPGGLTHNTVSDTDGSGRILADGTDLAAVQWQPAAQPHTWTSAGTDVSLRLNGTDLQILNRAGVAVATVTDFRNSGLGIVLPQAQDPQTEPVPPVGEPRPPVAEPVPPVAEGGPQAETLHTADSGGVVKARGGNDVLYGGSGRDLLIAGADDDTLYGGAEDDELYGEGGSDRLYGGAGGDKLAGGRGDDYLEGGAGSDRYVIERGFGRDRIVNADADADSTDILRITDGYTRDDFLFGRSGDDLVITEKADRGNEITVHQHFSEGGNGAYALDRIVFDDRKVWDKAAIERFTREDAELVNAADAMIQAMAAFGAQDAAAAAGIPDDPPANPAALIAPNV